MVTDITPGGQQALAAIGSGRASAAEFSLQLLAPMATALLLAPAFVASGFSHMAWFALVPFAWALWVEKGRPELYLGAYYGGVLFHLLGLDWLRTAFSGLVFDDWVGIAHAAGCFWVLALAVGRRFVPRSRWPMAVSLPVVWLSMEAARHQAIALFDGNGFPYLKLGTTLADCVHLRQVADVAGVAGTGWLVATVNGALFDVARHVCRRGRWTEARRTVVLPSLPAALALFAAFVYGVFRLAQAPVETGPVVALVTGDLKRATPVDAAAAGTESQVSGAAGIPAGPAVGRPDLFVWHEGAFDGDLVDGLAAQPTHDDYAAAAARVAARSGVSRVEQFSENLGYLKDLSVCLDAAVLVGCRRFSVQGSSQQLFNSVAYLLPGGAYQGAYDKRHLAPGIEFIPRAALAIGVLPRYWADGSADGERCGFEPGAENRVFALTSRFDGKRYRFGANICCDAHFPDAHLPLMGRSDPPDFFINVSDESEDSGVLYHQSALTNARFRAIECRRPYLKLSEGGYSAVIDSSGRVLLLGHGVGREQRALVAAVPLDGRGTLYSRLGDWLSPLASVVLLAGLFCPRLSWFPGPRQRRRA